MHGNIILVQFLSFELEKETSKTEESSSASVVKRVKYSSKTLSGLSKKEGKSCGGALGPDWHSGIEVKGLAGICPTLFDFISDER